MISEKLNESSLDVQNEWDQLSEVEMASSNAGEPWDGYPDELEGVDESEPDIDGVPQTVWRGERLYLGNLDDLGTRSLSTSGHEGKSNRNGSLFLARDKKYASTYAVGKDGVTFYDAPLPIENIPIGVIYKIDNHNNHLGATPTSTEPDTLGPFQGKFREFIADEVSPEDYEVVEIQIMDDFVADDNPWFSPKDSAYKCSGHMRSDFRSPLEVYKIKDQADLPQIIAKVKARMHELDQKRTK